MRKIVLASLILLFSFLVHGLANNDADSLLSALKNTPNKNKPTLLIEISQVFFDFDKTMAFHYATEAKEIAIGNEDRIAEGKAAYNLGELCGLDKDFSKALEHLANAADIFVQEKRNDLFVDVLALEGYLQKEMRKFDRAEEVLERGLKIAEENKYEKGIAAIYHNYGSLRWNQGKYNDAMYYYRDALDIKRELGDKDEIASELNAVGLAYRYLGGYKEAYKYYAEALTLLNANSDMKELGKLYNDLGNLFWSWNKYDSALVFYNQSIQIREKISDSRAIAKTYINVGRVHKDNYVGDSALIYYDKAKRIYESLGDELLIAEALHSIGNFLFNMNKHNEAINFYEDALKLRLASGDQLEIANTYNNIGTAHTKLNNIEKGINAYDKALILYEELDMNNKIAFTYLLKGNLYRKLNADSAMQYYQKAQGINKGIGQKKEMARCLKNIGNVYFALGKEMDALSSFQEAHKMYEETNNLKASAQLFNDVGNLYEGRIENQKKYYKKALKFAVEGKNYEVAGLCNWKLAQMAFDENNLAAAKNFADQSIKYAELSNKKQVLMNANNIAYQIMKELGNYQHAFIFLDKYVELKTEMDETAWKVKKMEYDVGQQLAKIERQELENAGLQEKQLAQEREKKLYLLGSIIVAALVLLVLLVLNKRYREKKRSEAALKMLNATKDKFFSIIAHDLRNPMHGIIGISEMIEKDKKLEVEKVRELNSMLYKTSKQVYDLLENLLQWARSQTDRIKYTPDPVNMKKIIEDTIDLFKSSANEKNIVLAANITDDPIAFVDKEMITAVARNLVSNAIKFTGDGGQVKVSAAFVNNHIEVSVDDSGVGIDEVNKEKLFRIDAHLTTKGTNNEEGSGLGLILCKEFVERNKGDIWVESLEGKGTSFKFSLPRYGNR